MPDAQSLELAHVFDIQTGPTLEDAARAMTDSLSRHMGEGYLPVSVSHAYGPGEDGQNVWSTLVFLRRERLHNAPESQGTS